MGNCIGGEIGKIKQDYQMKLKITYGIILER